MSSTSTCASHLANSKRIQLKMTFMILAWSQARRKAQNEIIFKISALPAKPNLKQKFKFEKVKRKKFNNLFLYIPLNIMGDVTDFCFFTFPKKLNLTEWGKKETDWFTKCWQEFDRIDIWINYMTWMIKLSWHID